MPTERILMYCDSGKRKAYVVEVNGDHVENVLEECGNDIDDWPDDLDAFNRHGLWMWEGETDGDYTWNGTIRKLSPEEWRSLHANQSPIN